MRNMKRHRKCSLTWLFLCLFLVRLLSVYIQFANECFLKNLREINASGHRLLIQPFRIVSVFFTALE